MERTTEEVIAFRQVLDEMTEYEHQVAFFDWLRTEADVLDMLYRDDAEAGRLALRLRMPFAIPNGGLRDLKVAKKLRREGVTAGVPDIFCPVAAQRWNGLFIEMKAKNGRLSEHQARFMRAAEVEGYRCVVAWSWVEAASAYCCTYLGAEDYLRMPTIREGISIIE